MNALNCNIFLSMKGFHNTEDIPANTKIALASATSAGNLSIIMLSFNQDREFEIKVYSNDASGYLTMIADDISQEWEGKSDVKLTRDLLRYMDEKVLEFEYSDEYEEERE